MGLPRDGYRYELLDGELIKMPAAGLDRGDWSMNISAAVHAFAKERNLGRSFSSQTGFQLGPDLSKGSVLSPDASFVSHVRFAELAPDPTKFLLAAPDFAAEVLSPRDSFAVMERKKDLYFQHGCRLFWIVTPRRREVHVYTPAGKQAVIGEDGILDGGDVLPGFTLAVRQIFA